MELTNLHQDGSSGPPLHYLQEISRKDVEIKELRNQQYQAETSLRELQLNISLKEERYQVRQGSHPTSDLQDVTDFRTGSRSWRTP